MPILVVTCSVAQITAIDERCRADQYRVMRCLMMRTSSCYRRVS